MAHAEEHTSKINKGSLLLLERNKHTIGIPWHATWWSSVPHIRTTRSELKGHKRKWAIVG